MKKIISFSLYGNKPNFQVGAVVNVLEAKRLYPDWKCRFYTTDDDTICKQLEYLHAEIVRMDDWPEGKAFWRFLAMDDSDMCLFRDTDSVVNERELSAVNEWLETDKQWHIMHDHRQHRYPIMAGMCGFKKGQHIGFKKNSVKNYIHEWLGSRVTETYHRTWDQDFLKDVILPMTERNCLKHGNFGKPFPPHSSCRYGNFVGDYSFWANGWKEFVNGDNKKTQQENRHPKKHERILDRVIIACDSNKDYLDFWPLVSAAWEKIGVKPTLVLIEKPDESIEVDESLGDILRIKLTDDSVHPTFAAQAVRLLAPALYPDENITIADIDIVPLSKEYFFENVKRGPEDSFIELRSGPTNKVESGQIPICWNVAKGSVWSEIFDIDVNFEDYQDVFVNRLKEWCPALYRPIQLGKSTYWFTDQKLLFDYLSKWNGTRIRLLDSETGFCRQDHRYRPTPMHDNYTDFCPRRPPSHNLAYKRRPDLDNIETIKHVFDWYAIPWIYDGEANMIEKQSGDNHNTNQQGFTHVFKNRSFGKSESASGPGSGDRQTQVLKKELKNLIGEYNIKSMFDCPCGDFYWMKDIINDASLLDIAYIGGDIVPEIIDNNKRDHGLLLNNKSNFIHFNIIEDTIPDVDLLLCRDLFVHLPTDTILGLLNKIKKSNVKYLLATTFMNRQNTDCPPVSASGAIGWRYVCLFTPPFSLPPPLKIISEVCTEGYPKSIDKSLGLWRTEDLRLYNE